MLLPLIRMAACVLILVFLYIPLGYQLQIVSKPIDSGSLVIPLKLIDYDF